MVVIMIVAVLVRGSIDGSRGKGISVVVTAQVLMIIVAASVELQKTKKV